MGPKVGKDPLNPKARIKARAATHVSSFFLAQSSLTGQP